MQLKLSHLISKQSGGLTNQSIKQKKTRKMGLKFIPLDVDSLRMMAFANASFATNSDMSSQLGFVICIANKFNRANIIQYASLKSKQVTRSVLAAELFAAVLAFDHSSIICLALNEMFGRTIPLKIKIVSKSL